MNNLLSAVAIGYELELESEKQERKNKKESDQEGECWFQIIIRLLNIPKERKVIPDPIDDRKFQE